MQAVADLHFLQFAEVIVEPGQGRVLIVLVGHAAVGVQPRRPAERQYFRGQHFQAPGIDARRFVVFIDQLFQVF